MKLLFLLSALFLSFEPISHAILNARQLAEDSIRHYDLVVTVTDEEAASSGFRQAIELAHLALKSGGVNYNSIPARERAKLFVILAYSHYCFARRLAEEVDRPEHYRQAIKFANQALTITGDSISVGERAGLSEILADNGR